MVFSLTSGWTWHSGEVLHLPHLNEPSILFITLLYVVRYLQCYTVQDIQYSSVTTVLYSRLCLILLKNSETAFFCVLLTVHLGITSVINQLNA